MLKQWIEVEGHVSELMNVEVVLLFLLFVAFFFFHFIFTYEPFVYFYSR